MPVDEVVRNMPVVTLNGAPLPPAVTASLVTIRVEQSTGLPDMFTMRFTDPHGEVLEKGQFDLGKKIQISAQTAASSAPQPLLEAEVTAMEFEVIAGAGFTMVRGFDLSHRLHRGTVTRDFQNMSASDIVRKVASENGIPAGKIDSTMPVFAYLSQSGQTDWDFLAALAARHQRTLYVRKGRLDFTAHPAASSAGGPELVVGENVVELRATVTAADQVGKVEARGWDPVRKEPIVQTASSETTSAAVQGRTPQSVSSALKRTTTLVLPDPRITDAQAAENLARSVADHRAGGLAEIDGVALGDPGLGAGTAVILKEAPRQLAGKFVLTAVRHDFDVVAGYLTHFTASHTSDRSMLGSVHGAAEQSAAPFQGVVPAVVTNIKDSEQGGRVKVKFPWWDNTKESAWCRTLHHGAGKNRGLVILPEVNDEVLVAFTGGDFNQPVVLGGLFNQPDPPTPAWGEHLATTGPGSATVKRRAWTSRTGMQVAFVEDEAGEWLEISTNNGAQKVLLRQSKKQEAIQIISQGPVEITAKKDVTVKASGDVKVDGTNVAVTAMKDATVKATGNAKVEGLNVEVSAKTQLMLKGTVVNVEANGPLTLKGAIVRIN